MGFLSNFFGIGPKAEPAQLDFVVPNTILRLRPLFISNGAAFLQTQALQIAFSEIDALRKQNLPPDERLETMGGIMQRLVQVLPKQLHHFQPVQTQAVQLKVDDILFDIEMWWPRVLPGSKATPAQAKPCCAMFAVRPFDGPVQIQLAYKPSMLWFDPNDSKLREFMITNVDDRRIIQQPNPKTDSPLYKPLRVIETENPTDAEEIDKALTATAAIFSGQLKAPDNFPQGLAQMLGLGGARHQMSFGR